MAISEKSTERTIDDRRIISMYKFLVVCLVAFLAVGVRAEANGELQDASADIRKIDIDNFDGIIDTIIDFLKDFFVDATTNCLKEVAHHCKKTWYNPKKLLHCAKEYSKEHQGECAIADALEYETMLMSIYGEDVEVEDVDLDIGDIDIENYDGIINAIADYLKDFFQQATVNCLKEVARNCKKIWYNPKKLLKCAKGYFKEHKGECAIPDSLTYENLLISLSVDNVSIENRNPLLQIAIRLLQQAFKWAAKHCIKEAAEHCKNHWNNPPALIDCGKNFFKANKGRCALG